MRGLTRLAGTILLVGAAILIPHALRDATYSFASSTALVTVGLVGMITGLWMLARTPNQRAVGSPSLSRVRAMGYALIGMSCLLVGFAVIGRGDSAHGVPVPWLFGILAIPELLAGIALLRGWIHPDKKGV